MTNKLYYEAPYAREFDARVLSCEKKEKGWDVILDKTVFYPEGGGQPCDLGTLGGAKVLDVHEKNGEIVHRCDAPLTPDTVVRGRIDWDRRFDLMQQHSGEHLVSGLIHAKYGYDNVGFHMGQDCVTIDFNGPIDEAGLREIERRANEAVYANLAAEIFYPDRETLAGLPYRSKKELAGQVRLVRFPGVDLCACCGTHVARTGEIGLIRLFSCVKFREGVRIEMLCGRRCLAYLRDIQEQNHRVSTQLSAKPLETGEAVRRICAELAEAKARIAAMEDELFRQTAERLAGQGDVLLFEAPMAPDSVRKLCDKVLSACGGRCAVFAGSDEAGWKYAVGSKTEDLRPFVKAMNAALRGRGGGKPGFVQGSAAAGREEIEAFFAIQ